MSWLTPVMDLTSENDEPGEKVHHLSEHFDAAPRAKIRQQKTRFSCEKSGFLDFMGLPTAEFWCPEPESNYLIECGFRRCWRTGGVTS